MSEAITELSAVDIRARVAAGELSARAVAEAHLAAVEATNPTVRALLTVCGEAALARAEEIDARVAAGKRVGPLAGVPVAVKDNLCTAGVRTSCASKILADFVPPYDATVVAKLRRADAVLIGKANLDEFAMGSSTENSAMGATVNPWATDRVPGGSSGGSAAAVAARMAPLALGSDTGGSIRLPASFCGVVGMKPTYGRVSRYGLVAYGSSLDQVGPFARNVADAALLLKVISGHDPLDATSVPRSVPTYEKDLAKPVTGLKIGVPAEFFGEGLDPEVAAACRGALEVYKAAGAKVVEVHLPHTRYAIACYYIVAVAEASSNLARYDGMHYGHRTHQAGDLVATYCRTRSEGFGEEVQRRIMLGTYALSSGYYDAYYKRALQVRRLIQQDYAAAFRQVHAIAGPVCPTPAFLLGEKTADPLTMYLSDIYTIGVNLAGLPAISIPAGYSAAGLPIGLHLIGPVFSEDRLLRIARLHEEKSALPPRRPIVCGTAAGKE
jgi:aspartyl-tRNA(Asn)/glutamyl-tRNA(Gln) amidotransferase subunit A